jgi:glycosyltransferase involved in cell wall biosynthesis
LVKEATNRPLSRILVFNFFAGIKARGIPVYARGLEECFRRLDIEHVELRAPGWVGRCPTSVQNVLFVLAEQLWAPVMARWHRCTWVIYPYNSCGVFDALTGRSVLVVHDLIPNRLKNVGLSARYIRLCQAWHAKRGRPVATVSKHTLRQLERVRQFDACPKYLWANPFYAFEAQLDALNRQAAVIDDDASRASHRTVLMCTGMGPNKDFRGALALLATIPAAIRPRVRLFGFGDDAQLAQRRVDKLPEEWRAHVEVMPRLSLEDTVRTFRAADLVWVHSKAEGFGRPVVEARLCGKPVLASDVGAFRALRRLGQIYLYRPDTFLDAFLAALGALDSHEPASAEAFNRQLEHEVARLLREAAASH